MEELDYPSEWFLTILVRCFYYNAKSRTTPPSNPTYDVPMLKTCFQSTPLKICQLKTSISRESFSGTLPTLTWTLMGCIQEETGVMPSGGDWGLQRMGALYFEGSENLLTQQCTFECLDGNIDDNWLGPQVSLSIKMANRLGSYQTQKKQVHSKLWNLILASTLISVMKYSIHNTKFSCLIVTTTITTKQDEPGHCNYV